MTPIIIGKSVRGESHIRHNIECQDSFLIIDGIQKHNRKSQFYNELPDDIKMIAVADGHGSESCPYSKTGSQTAVNVFCDIMCEYVAKYGDDLENLFNSLNREGDSVSISKQIVKEWETRIFNCHKFKKEMPRKEDGEIDQVAIYKQYGTTLLGMLITQNYIYLFQLGDGDITYVDENRVISAIETDKILGVETHSISKPDSWKKVHTRVINLTNCKEKPFMYILSTDGWVNSHSSEEEFHKTCNDYYKMICERGTKVVEDNLERWLSETSSQGCGDDITTVFAYFE